jgi:hypothetical protein
VAAWIDTFGEVVAAFMTADGGIASMPMVVALPPNAPYRTLANLSLAWNGTVWLVTWEEQVNLIPSGAPPPLYPYVVTPPSAAIRGARLSAALTPLDVQPITIATSPASNIRGSHVASDGHDFLVAWTTDGVRVRRVLSSGIADAERPLAAGLVQDLVWDGANYDVAFFTGSEPFTPGDLGVVQLGTSGQPLQTLVISATPEDDRSAALVPIGTGGVVAAYTRVVREVPYAGVERAFVSEQHIIRPRAAR